MSNPFDRLGSWIGARPLERAKGAASSAPAVSVLDLPRERLRAAVSLALGPGVSQRIADLGPGVFSDRAIGAVSLLERLRTDTSQTGRRFGTMLRELSSPDLLILALLLRDLEPDKPADERLATVRAVSSALELTDDSRHLIEFLINDDL